METFEAGVLLAHWASVRGGAVGLGCGALLPHAHGKTLHFSGCGQRHATTVELDTSRARCEVTSTIQPCSWVSYSLCCSVSSVLHSSGIV